MVAARGAAETALPLGGMGVRRCGRALMERPAKARIYPPSTRRPCRTPAAMGLQPASAPDMEEEEEEQAEAGAAATDDGAGAPRRRRTGMKKLSGALRSRARSAR